MKDEKVTRPLMRYHGSKWRIAPWIISHFPRHRIYVEPFGGSASVLLRKARAEIEVYNDLDGEIVNLFRVVRDHGEELARRVYLTPYGRDEFTGAFETAGDDIEQARRTIARSFMGWGSGYATTVKGGKASISGFCIGVSNLTNNRSKLWVKVPSNILDVVERMREVIIENLPYEQVIRNNDREDTLVYADPPYLKETRDEGDDYRHEFTEADHIALAKVLKETKGSVVLSGFKSELYNDLYHDWQVFKCKTTAVSNQERTEVLWVKGGQENMFDFGAEV
jgi:DNA adenine methylase